MGLRRRSSSTYTTNVCPCCAPKPKEAPLPNPNPRNFRIVRYEEIGNWLIVEIKYPDCTNYEGRKILVYYQVKYKKLMKQGSIDPHFSDSTTMISPFARFEPTKGGWNAARRLAQSYVD